MNDWYYLIDSVQQGPLTEAAFVQLFESGQLNLETLVWTDALENWVRAADLQNFTTAQFKPPPLPGAVATPPLPGVVVPPISQAPPLSSAPIFLHISLTRLILMSILSFGIYDAYWIYKNWRYLNERDRLNIKPFWRGIFGIFYCHSLMNAIHNDPQTNALKPAQFSAGMLATGWVILVVVANVISRSEDPRVILIGSIVTLPSFLFLIPVQNYINSVNQAVQPLPPRNKWWSFGHIVCFGVGLLCWLGLLAEYILPPEY